MEYNSLHFILNHEKFLQNKDELVYSLQSYYKACQNNDEIWSDNRKSQVLQLLDRFITRISKLHLPKLAGNLKNVTRNYW